MSMRRGIGAVVAIKNGNKTTKYTIENDGIINVTAGKAEYKGVRLVGTNQMGDGIRVITEDGPREIPCKLITKIEDAKKGAYPCVEIG